jgi:hypothetical protein
MKNSVRLKAADLPRGNLANRQVGGQKLVSGQGMSAFSASLGPRKHSQYRTFDGQCLQQVTTNESISPSNQDPFAAHNIDHLSLSSAVAGHTETDQRGVYGVDLHSIRTQSAIRHQNAP